MGDYNNGSTPFIKANMKEAEYLARLYSKAPEMLVFVKIVARLMIGTPKIISDEEVIKARRLLAEIEDDNEKS